MVNPKATTGGQDIGCWPVGLTDTAYSSFCEYPYKGQDFVIWYGGKRIAAHFNFNNFISF
ncbi:sex pilus assembly domain protein [Rickettsia amblyommatis str. Darkwater]|nr:sex pilus assembly domain protein [Rickettsia amblyommatis str. Darkwater]